MIWSIPSHPIPDVVIHVSDHLRHSSHSHRDETPLPCYSFRRPSFSLLDRNFLTQTDHLVPTFRQELLRLPPFETFTSVPCTLSSHIDFWCPLKTFKSPTLIPSSHLSICPEHLCVYVCVSLFHTFGWEVSRYSLRIYDSQRKKRQKSKKVDPNPGTLSVKWRDPKSQE